MVGWIDYWASSSVMRASLRSVVVKKAEWKCKTLDLSSFQPSPVVKQCGSWYKQPKWASFKAWSGSAFEISWGAGHLFRGVPVVGGAREDPGLAGGSLNLLWSGNALGSPKTSWKNWGEGCLGSSPWPVVSATRVQMETVLWDKTKKIKPWNFILFDLIFGYLKKNDS